MFSQAEYLTFCDLSWLEKRNQSPRLNPKKGESLKTHNVLIQWNIKLKLSIGMKMNAFLKEYTILEAIKDIEESWSTIPDSTIKKSFRKVFPKDKWEVLTGGNEPDVSYDFEGFGEADQVQLPQWCWTFPSYQCYF